MQVRFFNDAGGPEGATRVMIGLTPDHLVGDGGRFEAVHIASKEEEATFGVAYAAYEATENEKKAAAAKAHGGAAPADEKAEEKKEAAASQHEAHHDARRGR